MMVLAMQTIEKSQPVSILMRRQMFISGGHFSIFSSLGKGAEKATAVITVQSNRATDPFIMHWMKFWIYMGVNMIVKVVQI